MRFLNVQGVYGKDDCATLAQQGISGPTARTLGPGAWLTHLVETVSGQCYGSSAEGRIEIQKLFWRASQVWQVSYAKQVAEHDHGFTLNKPSRRIDIFIKP